VTAPTAAIAPIDDQGERDIDVGQCFSGCVGHFDGDLMPCVVGDGCASSRAIPSAIPSAIVCVVRALACVIDHGVEFGQLFQPESALVFEHGS
jgi:hypothetical protein